MKQEKAIFAAGCFWGVQYQFQRVPGVLKTIVGYTGGPEENPQYPEVKAHQTHHVEAIEVEYDAEIVSYEELCKFFVRLLPFFKLVDADLHVQHAGIDYQNIF